MNPPITRETAALPTFVAAVLEQHLLNRPWRDFLSQGFAQSGLELAGDGTLTRAADLIGCYRLLEPELAQHRMDAGLWRSLQPASQRLGRPVGYFCWTHAADEQAARAHLLPAVLRLCRGVIARPDNGQTREAVCRRNFPLTNLLGKHGFDDGEAFLDRSDATLREALGEVELALKAADLEGYVSVFGTHHNPLRLSGGLRRNGQVVDDEAQALDGLSISLWSYNWPVLDEVLFWID
ncbi:MAG TPA: hypothetical protein VES73_10250 [Lamprocystis sp. (in: g-proteobacteria)]|nr:hypothetical protein [Lamprocystis sp. (in: g-proteobacteria)]